MTSITLFFVAGTLAGVCLLGLLLWCAVRLINRQPIPHTQVAVAGVTLLTVAFVCGVIGGLLVAKKAKDVLADMDPVEAAGEVVGRTIVDGGSGLAEGFDRGVQSAGGDLLVDLTLTADSRVSETVLVYVVANGSGRTVDLRGLVEDGWIMGVDAEGVDVHGEVEAGAADGPATHMLPPGSKTRQTFSFVAPVVGVRVGEERVLAE